MCRFPASSRHLALRVSILALRLVLGMAPPFQWSYAFVKKGVKNMFLENIVGWYRNDDSTIEFYDNLVFKDVEKWVIIPPREGVWGRRAKRAPPFSIRRLSQT